MIPIRFLPRFQGLVKYTRFEVLKAVTTMLTVTLVQPLLWAGRCVTSFDRYLPDYMVPQLGVSLMSVQFDMQRETATTFTFTPLLNYTSFKALA